MEEKPETLIKSKAKGESLLRRWQQLDSDLQLWKPQWQEIADYTLNRKAGISEKVDTPSTSKEAALFDTTATDAAMTMAGGLMSGICPPNEQWFTYEPIFQLRGSEPTKNWLASCTEIVRELLATSNFYTEIHEDLLNHCVFGTSAMFIGMTPDQRLYFESLTVGSFAIAENVYGEVDTLFRELDLTAQQAVDLFTEEHLSKEIKDCLKDDKKRDQRHKFIHAVYPRPDNEKGKNKGIQAAWEKPFASCYVDCKAKTLVKESGYDSFPFAVGRYLKWQLLGGKTPYGYGPGFSSLPDVRLLNHLQMNLDCAAEKIVRPAMIAPDDMEGDIVLTSGGITYVPSTLAPDKWPRPIQQVGDYNVAVERVESRKKSVEEKFHVPLFKMFAGIERQMTATEVIERASEKIVLISPAFTRLQSEKLNPILRRAFSLAMEAGVLPTPPDEAVIPISETMGITPDPAVSYSSRLAMALDRLGLVGFTRQLEMDIQIASIRPDVFDSYDFDTMTRDRSRINSVPTAWMLPPEKVAQIREARAQQEQAMAMAQMVKDGSQAVKNVGGIDKAKEALAAA